MTQYQLKLAYEPASPEDGFRVYIDRLLAEMSLARVTFHYDLWDKDIAPSTELREWFHADPGITDGLNLRLDIPKNWRPAPSFGALRHLLAQKSVVTLLYSSHDERHNNAIVVYNLLTK